MLSLILEAATDVSNLARISMEGHSMIEVSAQITVADTSKAISQFSTVADRLYNEFAENLIS